MKWLVLIIILLFSGMAVGIQTAFAQDTENSDNIICSECGQRNSTDGLFCAGCGTKLVHPPEPPPKKTLPIIKKISSSYYPVLEIKPDKNADVNILKISNPTVVPVAKDLKANTAQDVISTMSRQDLIQLIELLTDKSYNKPQRFNPNLVGNMTRIELESLIRNNSNRHTSTKQNGIQIFLQVVGFITTLTFVIVILA